MGVDVKITAPGDNKTYPQKGENLIMHYTGKLKSNGNVFDSSVEKGRPFKFVIGVGQVHSLHFFFASFLISIER